jgi:hypothetical protein
LADQLNTSYAGQPRVLNDGVHERGAEAGSAEGVTDDYVEDHREVGVVGENSGEPVGQWIRGDGVVRFSRTCTS